MMKLPSLRTSIIASTISGLCCFSPLLILFLSTLGLGAAIGWLDFILLPSLVFFLTLTGYRLWKRSHPTK